MGVHVGCTGSMGIRRFRFCIMLNSMFLTVILVIVNFEIVTIFITKLQEVGRGCGDWMELAQDRDRWRALVTTVMNFQVP